MRTMASSDSATGSTHASKQQEFHCQQASQLSSDPIVMASRSPTGM